MIISHRGKLDPSSDGNTIASLSDLVQTGIRAVELDVRESRSGLVLYHDDEKDGVPVSRLARSQLGATVPYLTQVAHYLSETADHWQMIMIDIKCTRYTEYESVAGMLQKELSPIWDSSALHLCSFWIDMVRHLTHESMRGPKLGLITLHEPCYFILDRLDFISCYHEATSDSAIQEFRDRNPKSCIFVWTVNDPNNDIATARVDGIITDCPRLFSSKLE